MKKIIKEGGVIPKGYGVTWRMYNSCLDIICHPIPINLIIRFYMHCYWALQRGLFRSKYEGALITAIAKGYYKAREELLK